MKIGGFQKLTLIDYPGKIASTIFTIGCNFKCPFCYNNRLINDAEESFSESVLSFLEERKKFLDGVVICGGEPTIQKDLPEFCIKLKQLGFLIKIDTNGSRPEMLKELIDNKLINYIAMDVKTILSEKYNKAAGVNVDINKIKESINIIKKLEHYEFRTTCVPGLVTQEDLIGISKYLKAQNANKAFYLQQFKPITTLDKKFEKIKPYSESELLKFKEKLKSFFDKIEIRS